MTRKRHKSKNPQQHIVDDLKGKVPAETKHTQLAGGKRRDTHVKLELRPFPICWGLPFDEVMFSQFMANFVALDYMPWDFLATTQSTYLPEARNEIHNMFLNELGGSHLFMLDSDVLPPPGIIGSLLAHEKDMVGGFYRKKEKFATKNLSGETVYIQRPVVYDYSHSTDEKDLYKQRLAEGNGMERVDAAGAGCWLMSRKVAEALGESPYDLQRGGEDMVLSKKVNDLGFELWIDWNLPCAHLGTFFV